MRTCNHLWRLTLAAVFLAAPTLAEGIEDFKLARAIPADVAMTVLARDHDGMTFVNQQLARVYDALESQRLDREIKRLLKQQVEQEGGDLQQFESGWQKINDLVQSIDWQALCARESAFAMRMGVPMPEMVMLCLPEKGKSDELYDTLADTLEALASLDPTQLNATRVEAGPAKTTRLNLINLPLQTGLTVAQHDETIVLAIGNALTETVLAMLDGKGGESLVKTSRFREAFKPLPAPRDSLTYVDMERMFQQLRGMMDNLMQMAGPPPQEGTPGYEEQMKQREMPKRMFAAFDFIDYIASVSSTDGMATRAETVTKVRKTGENAAFRDVFFSERSFNKPLKYVPKQAAGVSVSAGIDWLRTYRAAMDMFVDVAPEGQQAAEQWKQQQEMMGINVEEDYLSWIEGKFVSFNVPGPSKFAPAEWAMMISVRDTDRARKQLDMWNQQLEPMLVEQKGTLDDAPIEGTEGFKTVSMPMLAFVPGLASPTYGVADGWLIFGSSGKVIEMALNTSVGKNPDFSQNERFQEEGVDLRSQVKSVSFTDLSGWGDSTAQALAMVPMASMMNPDLAKDPGWQLITRLASKFSKVAKEVNFLASSSSQSWREGDQVYEVMITNYREPPAPAGSTGSAK